MDLFIAALCILIVVCITLHVYTREEQQESLDGNFRRLQISYLAVYLLGSGKLTEINLANFTDDLFKLVTGFKARMSMLSMKVMVLENMRSKFYS